MKNLALLGRLLATASLAREESRGAHYRTDFPDTDDKNWSAVTRLEQGPDGEIVLHKDPLKQGPNTKPPPQGQGNRIWL